MTSRVRIMQQSWFAACPFCIFEPDHYRVDGSCRCDDPEHREMAEWGYVWADGAWRAPPEEED